MSQQDIDEIKAMAATTEAAVRAIAEKLHQAQDGGDFARTMAEIGALIVEIGKMTSSLVPAAKVEAEREELRDWRAEKIDTIRRATPAAARILQRTYLKDLDERHMAFREYLANHQYEAWSTAWIGIGAIAAMAKRGEVVSATRDEGKA